MVSGHFCGVVVVQVGGKGGFGNPGTMGTRTHDGAQVVLPPPPAGGFAHALAHDYSFFMAVSNQPFVLAWLDPTLRR